jgi:hypothetical protein
MTRLDQGYKQLEDLGIEFKREEIELHLFDASVLYLEKRGLPLSQENLEKVTYNCINYIKLEVFKRDGKPTRIVMRVSENQDCLNLDFFYSK